jgi:glutathione peroxidase
VNTASHCGFTPLLKNVETLHQKYQDKGLVVVGFSSNDVYQAAKSEEQAAKICSYNVGVTFTMIAPTHVKGSHANPVFSYLTEATNRPPTWIFTKYLMASDGTDFTIILNMVANTLTDLFT